MSPLEELKRGTPRSVDLTTELREDLKDGGDVDVFK